MPAAPDVEQQRTALETNKTTNADDNAHFASMQQLKRTASRFVPTNRVARYLCLAAVLSVIVFLVTSLVFWFTTKPLYLINAIVPPTNLQWDERAVQWYRNGTAVRAISLWDCVLFAVNDNAFPVNIEDLVITAKFTARAGHDVQFGTTRSNWNPANPNVPLSPTPAALSMQPGSSTKNIYTYSLPIGWDLADHEQANAVASLLVLCGVNSTSLPAPLNNPAELPVNASAPDAGIVRWYLEARRVSGWLGLDMTLPPPGRIEYWRPNMGKVAWGGSGVSPSIMDVVCHRNLSTPRDFVHKHILELANLTRAVCEETGKCQ
ncbi:hypothetical protein GGF31_004078 [Allomyces arbusculus]|nr:hypothetical protein GGF31_004078 [Allomyces arbusculus]